MLAGEGFTDRVLAPGKVREIFRTGFADAAIDGRRVLALVPDGTRTVPLGLAFRALHEAVAPRAAKLDVLIALGTHPPMTEGEINARLEMTPAERAGAFRDVAIYNHLWQEPGHLREIGSIPAREIGEITGGLFAMDVPIVINRLALDYDLLVVLGPVFPHEVVGFSGGAKYLFPGIAGEGIINFFHWLGAVITNPRIIGRKRTPVRAVLDRAAAMVPTEKMGACMVVKGEGAEHAPGLAGLYVGPLEEAWSAAADLSEKVHIEYRDRAYDTVLSCAPEMYDDIWTAGKCMYKLEPVVADGGELIIYAPHVTEISVAHGRVLREIGYHVRDYFLADWDRYKQYPWGVVAHSTHVRGIGRMEGGIEKPRVSVTLATGIPEDVCRAVNLGYRDPASIDVADYENREDEGVLYVPKAGEMLYRLENPPEWAR